MQCVSRNSLLIDFRNDARSRDASEVAIMLVREAASVGGKGSTAWFVATKAFVACVFHVFFSTSSQFSFDDTREIASD